MYSAAQVQAKAGTNWMGVGRVTGWPGFINLRVASEEQWCIVREVRKRAYELRKQPAPAGLLRDSMDSDPNSETFLLLQDGVGVATIRTAVNEGGEQMHLTTSVWAFGRERVQEAAHGRRFLDVSRFCVCQESFIPDIRRTQALLQNVTVEADLRGCEFIVATARTAHRMFYESLGFELKSESRQCDGIPYEVTLYALKWPAHRERLLRNPAFQNLFPPASRSAVVQQ